MNEKLLGLVVSSTVYWLLTQFPLGQSTVPLPLPHLFALEVQLNILPYLIENALELVLQLGSQRSTVRLLLALVWTRLEHF